MVKNFKGIKFKYGFRDYQEKFLDNIMEYLGDEKIHVVAAPGAGKTILALEMCRILDEKALIIVPSIALKEQWIERLRKDFIGADKPGFISSSLSDSGSNAVVTVITYQMLHSMVRRGDDVVNLILSKNIKTIVLDECHHMRRIWFNSLKGVVAELKQCKLISLTATPPYDNGLEFRNYMELCGDIDERITPGQLVKSNCLCPHQDFVYLNLPSIEQIELMESIRNFSDGLMEEVQHSEQFIVCLALHDYICFPSENKDAIIKDFDFYIALCSFLFSVGVDYNAIGLGIEFQPPVFDKIKLGLILERYLYGKIPESKLIKEYLDDIKYRLEQIGCVKEKHIDLIYSDKLSKKILANSGKLDSICEIVDIEYDNLGEGLNMAICTDYIKNEFYKVENEEDINEIGIIPIFRKLRDKCPYVNLVVLTGSLVFIPTELVERFKAIAFEECGVREEDIKIKELGIDFDYSSVDIIEGKRKYIVNIITKLFNEKSVQVLIGTIALIGEGWDAPFINSLIIASSVSTYVTSNQVRGRAIRVDSREPNKVSNIWHLVTMETYENWYILGKDFRSITNRFVGIEGVNSKYDMVEMGSDRLNIDRNLYSEEDVLDMNKRTIELASNREATKISWERALRTYVPEYYERISDSVVNKQYHAKLKFLNKSRVNRMTKGLLVALKRAGLLPSNASFRVRSKRKDNYDVVLSGANTHDQIMFASAVEQQYDITDGTRYIVLFFDRIYPVPDVLGRKKNLAEIYRQSLRLPFSKLVYVKNDEGKNILLRAKLSELS